MQLSAERLSRDGRSETRFVEVVFPDLANHYGTLFGGNALNLMSKAAFVAATRYARHNVMMATSDKIEFRDPIPVGELVELVAHIERVGRSSMTVAVEMFRENLLARQLCAAHSKWWPLMNMAGRYRSPTVPSPHHLNIN